MNRLFRHLLAWLLLVAVPLQGYAAGAMVFCGAAHGRAESTVVDHAAHGHAGHAHGDAGHQAGLHHVTPAHGDEVPSSGIDHADFAHGACSVCAACCSGAALPAATLVAPFAMAGVDPALPSEQPAPERAPTALERPPRIALA
jgi:hypothetical protein